MKVTATYTTIIILTIIFSITWILTKNFHIPVLIILSALYLLHAKKISNDAAKATKFCKLTRWLSIVLIILSIAEIKLGLTMIDSSFFWILLLLSICIGAVSLIIHTIIACQNLNRR